MSKATVVQRRPITTALAAMIRTATGRQVGDPDFLTDDNPPELYEPSLSDGYFVVHSIPGGDLSAGPPLHAPWSEGVLPYQVDSVGGTRGHVEWLADRVRLSMLSRNPDGTYQVPFPHPPGWKVIRREADSDIAPGVDKGGTPEHRVFSVSERFRLHVVPNL